MPRDNPPSIGAKRVTTRRDTRNDIKKNRENPMPGNKKQPRQSPKAKTTASGPDGMTVEDINLARAFAKPFMAMDSEGARLTFERALAPTWALWKVKPKLEPMPASPPESGIGKRIAYCRGQLGNLPIEALARYTKNFDEVGVSRASLVRYEAGGTMPGARELRILCDALWVAPGWLLAGEVGTAGLSVNEFDLINALGRMIRQGSGGTKGLDDDFEARAEAMEVEKRQKWMDEARKPQPRG